MAVLRSVVMLIMNTARNKAGLWGWLVPGCLHKPYMTPFDMDNNRYMMDWSACPYKIGDALPLGFAYYNIKFDGSIPKPGDLLIQIKSDPSYALIKKMLVLRVLPIKHPAGNVDSLICEDMFNNIFITTNFYVRHSKRIWVRTRSY